ncbi:MAG: response regulator transcription factor [bacterium]|nr:response regulator transcription factor [bacterium]
MTPLILVVDDQEAIVRLVTYNLEQAGYRTISAADGEEALAMVRSHRPDLVILDLMLPVVDGLEVCRRLRRQGNALPIIMLTAKGAEVDRVVGLELGADDYLAKPFSPRELVARIGAVLRRAVHVAPPVEVSCGAIVLNPETYRATVDGKPVDLTRREFELLACLARHPGRVFTREQLLDLVWGYEFAGGTRLVDMHVSNLRDKIETDRSRPRRLLTVRGVGYKLEADR